jgi:SAM-dependent methyltransferase
MAASALKNSAHHFFYRFHMLVPKFLVWSRLHSENYHPDIEGIKLRIETAKADPHKYSLLRFWGSHLGKDIDVANKRVLEIGHGGGWYLAEMIDAGSSLACGVEISLELNERAFQALTASGYSNFQLHLGNGKNLQVLQGLKFDFIYANTVVQHLSTFTFKKYLKDIRSILEEGGTCILQVLQTTSRSSQKRLSSSDLFSVAYTFQECQSLVTNSGMSINQYAEIHYGNDDHYWGLYVLSNN